VAWGYAPIYASCNLLGIANVERGRIAADTNTLRLLALLLVSLAVQSFDARLGAEGTLSDACRTMLASRCYSWCSSVDANACHGGNRRSGLYDCLVA
jgi:hypothetical protein